MERLNATQPTLLPDGWEVRYGLSPCVRATAGDPAWDADGDGLGLFDEYRYCTSPLPPADFSGRSYCAGRIALDYFRSAG